MKEIVDIGPWSLAAGYLLLLLPLAVILFRRVPILKDAGIAIVRMTAQLLFVGFYLHFLFERNDLWLNLAWVAVMIGVADASIVRGCKLKVRRFALPLFLSLLAGTAVPVAVFVWPVLRQPWYTAQYLIPLTGMVLGNCLRADIIGLRTFYGGVKKDEKAYHLALSQGATSGEALAPHVREALQAALLPTVATMATIGLVALPGMMTGVILGGNDPLVAIKYQIVIMIAIFAGTAVTVFLAILLTARSSFDAYGVLDRKVFADGR